LPEIEATLGDLYVNTTLASSPGAFYNPSNGTSYAVNVGGAVAKTTSFKASLSESIYGNSSTVQPPAVTALPCIKY
jgi:hypothetical protein